jgi:hypothetical protein
MMQQMQQQMKNLAAENERLSGLVATLLENNRLPSEQINQLCDTPQVSTEIVEWLPSHAPRSPPGTPQTLKKSKVSTSPSTNQFDALSGDLDDLDDVEMDEETEAILAAVKERINTLHIRNTHATLDSINKKNGAGGMK